jgi:hypothetical protein
VELGVLDDARVAEEVTDAVILFVPTAVRVLDLVGATDLDPVEEVVLVFVCDIDLVTLGEPVLVLLTVIEPVLVRVLRIVSEPLDDLVNDAEAEVVFDGAIERDTVGDAVTVLDP